MQGRARRRLCGCVVLEKGHVGVGCPGERGQRHRQGAGLTRWEDKLTRWHRLSMHRLHRDRSSGAFGPFQTLEKGLTYLAIDAQEPQII